MNVPKHILVDAISIVCLLINQMPSLVLNWDIPFHTFFPNKPMFPIESQIFGCTCFVGDLHLLVTKFDTKSWSAYFLATLKFKRGINVNVLIFIFIWFQLVSHSLRVHSFLYLLFIPVKRCAGGMMNYSFILLPHWILLLLLPWWSLLSFISTLGARTPQFHILH